jgi:hypothetical protein
MTDEDRAEAEKKLKGRLGACANCGGRNWAIGEIVHLLPWSGGSVVVGGGAVPALLVACTSCYALVPFSAVGLGLVPTGPQKEK